MTRPLIALYKGPPTQHYFCSVDGCNKPHHAKAMCHQHYRSIWRKHNPIEVGRWNGSDAKRNSSLKYRFGITLDDYNELMIKQNGVCKLCKNKCSTNQRLCVDHNHVTGQVRGLLCRRCNAGISIVEDNTDWLNRAGQYLGGDNLCHVL